MNQDSASALPVIFTANTITNNYGASVIMYSKNRNPGSYFQVTNCEFIGNTNGTSEVLSIILTDQSTTSEAVGIYCLNKFLGNNGSSIVTVTYNNAKSYVTISNNSFSDNIFSDSLIKVNGPVPTAGMKIQYNHFIQSIGYIINVLSPYQPGKAVRYH